MESSVSKLVPAPPWLRSSPPTNPSSPSPTPACLCRVSLQSLGGLFKIQTLVPFPSRFSECVRSSRWSFEKLPGDLMCTHLSMCTRFNVSTFTIWSHHRLSCHSCICSSSSVFCVCVFLCVHFMFIFIYIVIDLLIYQCLSVADYIIHLVSSQIFQQPCINTVICSFIQ